MSKPEIKGSPETFNSQRSTFRHIKPVRRRLKVERSTLNVSFVLAFIICAAFLPSSPADQKLPSKIVIKARDISGSDMTTEECLRKIRGVSINKDLRGAKLDETDISNTHLFAADLAEASLKKTIICNANLSRANLARANLEGAVLEKTNLSNANLANANLQSANLSNANLKNASLICANLKKAVLINADLSGANLMGAIIEGARLEGAILTGAVMPDGQVHP